MPRRRLLLLAATTGYQIRAFGDAAARLGVELLLASDRCPELDDPWRDGAMPVRFDAVEASVARVRAALADRPPDGLLAVGDGPVPLAAGVAGAFGLPWHRSTGAASSVNKLAARRAFAAAGLPSPWFEVLPLDRAPDGDGLPYPVVIKPLSLSGSCGVMRADTPVELGAAAARLRRLLAADGAGRAGRGALVEAFIPGREFAVEGLVTHGVFRPLAIFDKPDPLDGPYFEETIYVTPSRAGAAVEAAILATVGAAVRALGLWHGPVHAECRVNDAGVYMLELAARPIGGLCARALQFVGTAGGTPEPLEALLMRHALGEDADAWRREPDASGVMMLPVPGRGILRAIRGEADARAVPGITDVRMTARRDGRLVPPPEGRSYPGFLFARGATPGAVEAALREAQGRLAFDIDVELPVI